MKSEGIKPVFHRRRVLAWMMGLLAAPRALGQLTTLESRLTQFAAVVPGYQLRFPRDEGSHPEFRTEWWYVTGWLTVPGGVQLGFQVTFFRVRLKPGDENPSAFAPRQILVAHAALSDAAYGRLQHDQRVARAALGLAGANPDRLEVWIDDWTLRQDGSGYLANLPARDFQFDFMFTATQPLLLQGVNGYSRKGPDPESASYYYSLPQLRVTGTLTRNGKAQSVTGSAWLDHEWSSRYMDQDATGWDWIGINLADGGALMAFRMRDRQGGKFWAGGTYRSPDGATRTLGVKDVDFTPRREWRSARTGTAYPVAWHISAGALAFEVEPLMDDQEHDTRSSTGTIYWEGAVRALQHGRHVGSGYLEMTGYWRPMQL